MYDFRRITLFFWKNASKAQNDYIFQKFGGGMAPFPPLATPMVAAIIFNCILQL